MRNPLKYLLLLATLATAPAVAHHGWAWATEDDYSVTGSITEARLGNPHGELTLDVDGTAWNVEVGQPWRNDRAGLTAELLSEGRTITVHGAAAPEDARIKAVRVVIDGEDYVLYPGR
ncbi:DUF6152 family protein [Spiribacter halobius]|uniref:DNA-binding protein n=1 Tax=Sediminicurvatus halobius TaxID=2182432 RepID=A0A2U2N8X2_9GAMM|nr:DUF6152 family protein [Spiribacter halobius]PWG65404.1 hypothetical protein DEM34_01280 [Spiribacter halobius]UEX76423.1 DUF6152 family protein [Spiribacter halobius]